MLDVHRLMKSLSKRRPIFHSEADFQHEFAWEVREASPNCQLRLEYPQELGEGKAAHLDIWISVEQIAIELKYYTREFDVDQGGETFQLRKYGAHPPKRYDFLNDIQRLEQSSCNRGIAILLTNEYLYWMPPPRSDTIDAAFRIHELREIVGAVMWRGNPAEGTIRNRETPITLNGTYTMHWQDYSALSTEPHGQFRYLAVLVEKGERLPKWET